MNNEQIKALGKTSGLTGNKLNLFVEFISKYLPSEDSVHKIESWAKLFLEDKEWIAADFKGKDILIDLDEKKYGKYFYKMYK